MSLSESPVVVVMVGAGWAGGQRYFDTLSMDLIDGIWTPLEVTMTTKQGKQTLHKTAISFSNVKYNQDLDESLFTVRYLERDL